MPTLLLPAFVLGKAIYDHFRDINARLKRLRAKGLFKNVLCKKHGRWERYYFTKRQALDFNKLVVNKARREAGHQLITKFFSQVPNQVTPPSLDLIEPAPSPATNGGLLTVAPKEMGEINYRGLFTVRLFLCADGKRYVMLNDIADAFGVDRSSLWRKVRRSGAKWGGVMMTTPLAADAAVRGLAIDILPGLVLGIHVTRCRPEIRPHIQQVQTELYKVLSDYEFEGNASNPAFSREERQKTRARQDTEIDELKALAKRNSLQMAQVLDNTTQLQTVQLGEIAKLCRLENKLDANLELANLKIEELQTKIDRIEKVRHINEARYPRNEDEKQERERRKKLEKQYEEGLKNL